MPHKGKGSCGCGGKMKTERKKTTQKKKKKKVKKAGEKIYQNKPKDTKAKMNKTIVEKPATHSRVRKGVAMTNFKAKNY